jgi:hypothetical protein
VSDRCAKIRQLEAELSDRLGLRGAAQSRRHALHERAVVVRVRGAHHVGLAALLQPPEGVLAHDRQQ